MATKSEGQGAGTTFTAWKTPEGDIGSYGINGWVIDPKPENTKLPGPIENYWKNPRTASRTGYIPLMMDSRHFFALQSTGHMQRLCINRHDGYINMAYLDWSVRRTGLKELWMLKWHRNYNTQGPWTRDGGGGPTDWPQWMINLKDY